MATTNINFTSQINKEIKRIKNMDSLLGTGLNQPNNATNSSSRKNMYNQHLSQYIPIKGSEVALSGTGYEIRFGERSSSFIIADHDYDVIVKIPKFSSKPNHHYYLITFCAETCELGLIERKSYTHTTEAYGYTFNNDFLDSLKPTSSIAKGSVIRKSDSFDEFNNHMEGTNLTCIYLASSKNMEDGIIMSDVAAEKMASQFIKPVEVVINENDIPLNLYGNDASYKVIPDIGEEVNGGILCAIRREKKEDALYMQSKMRLRELMMSDEKYPVAGTVVDIDIKCNSPESMNGLADQQLKYYQEESMRVYRNVVSAVDSFLEQEELKDKDGNSIVELEYYLDKLYYQAKTILNGGKFAKEGKAFSKITLNIVLIQNNPMSVGDKLANRFGGKGVVSLVVPQNMMPRDDMGNYIDIIWNQCTCVNRENPGQLFETSKTHAGKRTIEYMKMMYDDIDMCIGIYDDYMNAVAKDQGDYYSRILSDLPDDEKRSFINSIIEDDGINFITRPMDETCDIMQIKEMYNKLPWATSCTVDVPIVGSNGKVRYVPASRKLICGKEYVYRLKQYAEEKFSATSLSATNIRNENSRSRAFKNFKAPYPKTPIRFGEMESGDLCHAGAEFVVILLMLYSASPHGRRLAEELYTNDPFNIDIKLDSAAKNRGVEIANAYLKTMGLRLVFKKTKVQLKDVVEINPVHFADPFMKQKQEMKDVVYILPEGCKKPYENYAEMNLEDIGEISPVEFEAVKFLFTDNKGPDYNKELK